MTLIADVWFLLIFVLFAIYSILDGFDLGVGFWYIFVRDSDDKPERRLLLSSIGPFWDGNEVWLLLAGGVIFIAFRNAYATLFSGFYLPVIVLGACLIFRAVAIEFRNEVDSPKWHLIWDILFILGSVLPIFLFGVVAGNVLRGLPIDATSNYAGTLFDLLSPFAILVGLLAVAMFVSHAAIFLTVRVKGELAEKAREWTKMSLIAYLVLYILPFVYAFILEQDVLGNYNDNVILFIVPLIGLLAIGGTYFFWSKKQELFTFATSAISIFVAFLVTAIAIYPNLLRDTTGVNSLTISNSASSEMALITYLIVALIGLPIALIYFIFVYRLHRGKIGLREAALY
ncbi:MAG: cytochrome d ubiquinol oxidase subunit II [Candidatus Thorarchaeota archaeon]